LDYFFLFLNLSFQFFGVFSKKDKYLNFEKLPQRPEKVKMKLLAITPVKAPWTPPVNHPWRAQIKQKQLTHNSLVFQV
jgi:hypothetical protein